MIRLRPDCLVFKSAASPAGEATPVSVQQITLELLGHAANYLDAAVLKEVASGVLHYFKEDLGQETVSAQDFAVALEKALCEMGFDVKTSTVLDQPLRVAEADLQGLARANCEGWELAFFPRLREEVRRQLVGGPQLLRFRGLRGCVKHLVGTKRWTQRCQDLQDQIVGYLRTCLTTERGESTCTMLVT
jgi:hypothetical protein